MKKMMTSDGSPSARIMLPEICERLQVKRKGVYDLLRAKIIPAIKFGGRWVIRRYAYEEWERNIEENKRLAVERMNEWSERKRREISARRPS